MKTKKFDLVVIGAGSALFAAAHVARELNKTSALSHHIREKLLPS